MDSSNAWGTYVNNKKSLLSFKYHFQCVFAFRACQIVPFRFVPIRFVRSFVRRALGRCAFSRRRRRQQRRRRRRPIEGSAAAAAATITILIITKTYLCLLVCICVCVFYLIYVLVTFIVTFVVCLIQSFVVVVAAAP